MTRTTRLILCGLIVCFGSLCAWTAFARSLIPVAINGVVTDKDIESGTLGRIERIEVDGRARQVDRRIAEKLNVGDRVSKEAWDTRLGIGERGMRLRVGPEVTQFALLTVLGVGAVYLVSRSPGSRLERDEPIES